MNTRRALRVVLFLAVVSSAAAEELSIVFELPQSLKLEKSTRTELVIEGEAGSDLSVERSVSYEVTKAASGYELRMTLLSFRCFKGGVEQVTVYSYILPCWSLRFGLDAKGIVTGLLNAAEVLEKLAAAYSPAQLAEIRQAFDLDKQVQADAAEWAAYLAKHASRTYVVGRGDVVEQEVTFLDGKGETLEWQTGARRNRREGKDEAVLSFTYNRAKPSQEPDIAQMSDLSKWWWSDTYGTGLVEHTYDLGSMLLLAETEQLRLVDQTIQGSGIAERVRTQTSSTTYRYGPDRPGSP